VRAANIEGNKNSHWFRNYGLLKKLSSDNNVKFNVDKDRLTMGYFDNLDNESLNKSKINLKNRKKSL
jgi:hypothetical protein